MRLFRSELLRARSRRLVAMLLVGGMLATVFAMTIAALNSTPASQASIDRARSQSAKNVQSCLEGAGASAAPTAPAGYDSLQDYCEEENEPHLGDAGVWLHDLPVVLMGISTFVVLLAAWLGASLAGADWTNGTMATVLTWEPRRARVLLTRAVVVIMVIAFVLLFLQVFFSIVFSAVAALFGTTALSPPDLWTEVVGVIGRVCAIGVAFGLIAYAVAMIGRSTVASLGVLFGYLVLVEGVIAGFRPTIMPWLLIRAAGVAISQIPMTRGMIGTYEGFDDPNRVLLSVGGAWQLIAVYVVGLLVLALVVFRRRDVN